MMIKAASETDLPYVTQLALSLWSNHTADEMKTEMANVLGDKNAVIFLFWKEGRPVAFAQCQLRVDYVEGTQSSPVGYLEGIYVSPNFRKTGIAKALLQPCKAWARGRGCREFASDCELDHWESLQFHLKNGFSEVNRIICFYKKL